MSILIVDPGLRTSIQDAGRFGFGAHGVPASGPMDPFSMRAADLLVHDEPHAACLEFTLIGPTIRARTDVVIAIVGSTHEPKTMTLLAGELLRVGRTVGAVGYLAVAGGFLVEQVLGSRATHVGARLGPTMPTNGTILPTGGVDRPPMLRLRDGEQTDVVRVVAGPHGDGMEGEFTVDQRADRTGTRLLGQARATQTPDVPIGAARGTIQLPPDGAPIVLGPDGPVTGGYPQIAQVIAADLGIVGQAKPGASLRFATVTLAEARDALIAREQELRERIGTDRP